MIRWLLKVFTNWNNQLNRNKKNNIWQIYDYVIMNGHLRNHLRNQPKTEWEFVLQAALEQ